MELFKKYRPNSLKKVVGQDSVVTNLHGRLTSKNLPHCLLFSGPSGCGKTTLARIVAKELGCVGQNFQEVNCADFRGIDTVRDIRSSMMLAPLGGTCRVWLVDECHKLSNDAQNALLKICEEPPKHVWIMLATTDPDKLIATLRNRCTQYAVKCLTPGEMETLLERVTTKEEITLSEDARDKIIEIAEGSARRALVLLDQIREITDEKEQLTTLQKADVKRQAIELARTLIRKCSWPEVVEVLKTIDEDPEQLRHMVLGYAAALMLKPKPNGRAYLIIDAFARNFYDSKRAGLYAACYEVVFGDK